MGKHLPREDSGVTEVGVDGLSLDIGVLSLQDLKKSDRGRRGVHRNGRGAEGARGALVHVHVEHDLRRLREAYSQEDRDPG